MCCSHNFNLITLGIDSCIFIMQKEKKQKVRHKGVFICNQRKKRAGGRIRCAEFPNKIEVYQSQAAIHESEVEWIEIRRYKKDKNNGKKTQSKKQVGSAKREQKTVQNVKENLKQNKYKEKNEETNLHAEKQEKKNSQASKQLKDNEISKGKQVNNQTAPKKKLKYKKKQQDIQKPNTPKQENTESDKPESTVSDVSSKAQQSPIAVTNPNNDSKVQVDRSQNETQRGKQQQKAKQSQSQSQEDKQDLQIIVAQVVKETKIVYKTKPFVAIMNFVINDRKRNQKNKKVHDSPIQQILQDFFVDIVPIHSRLPIMQMDDLIPENKQILYEYVVKHLKYDKEAKRKSELNRIIEALSNTYIFVTFSDWDGNFPLAKIQKILGKALTIEGQCQRFLYQHGLNDFHYEEVQTNQNIEIKIQPTALHKKIDRMVFSIDPPTSTDLDDALSIQKVGQLFQVGIHISDVSSFLSHINREQITKRTTSVYLPYKVYHMLQRHLVKTCSLDPGVDRLAFTIWVNMDLEGNVIGQSKLQKNVIRSRFKLSYQVVQNIITGKCSYEQFKLKYDCTEEQFQNLQQKLLNLALIAGKHREKRVLFDVFENKELDFKTNEENWPTMCFIDNRYTAKKVVEEYMIIGNIQSARWLVKTQPKNALVIHHPKPSKLAVTSFNESFKVLETKFKFENVLDVQRQLVELQKKQNILDQIKKACYFRARRVMQPAIYRKYDEIIQEQKKESQRLKNKEKQKLKQKQKESQSQTNSELQIKVEQIIEEVNQNSPIIHFALGLQFYTHFTSPMRRMADIIVHQVLTKTLQGETASNIELTEIEKINNGRKSTKRLKKDINEIYICLMIYHTKIPLQAEGILLSFGKESVSIYIPLFDMQKQVLWKKQFDVYSVDRIKNKEDCLDVKVKHDRKQAKGDIYWVAKKFQKVKLIINCNCTAPLKLTLEMEVQSEKGAYTIKWVN